MRSRCEYCKLNYLPEPGFYLGSIYFNYFATSLLVTVIFFGLYLGANISPKQLVVPLTVFCVLFPVWFFRYARSLWRAFDELFDPGQTKDAPDTADRLDSTSAGAPK